MNLSFVLALFILYFLFAYSSHIENFVSSIVDSNFKNIEKRVSNVDGKEYTVQSEFPDKQKAVNMISEINNIIVHFINELNNKYPNDNRVRRLVKRYNAGKLFEGNPFNANNSTSYSIAKGQKLVICMRSKHTKNIHKRNLLMFVCIHELAHLASESYGHNDEFIRNFRFLLEKAMDMGIYKYQNFYTNPMEYCGMTINTTPI